MITGRWSMASWACLFVAIGFAGCADHSEYHLVGEVPVNGDSREFLMPIFTEVEGLEATIESSRLLWHRRCEPRQDRMIYFEWLYLVPDDAPLKLERAFDTTDICLNYIVPAINNRLRSSNICIQRVDKVEERWGLDVGTNQYDVTDVRSPSGRFVFIECIHRF